MNSHAVSIWTQGPVRVCEGVISRSIWPHAVTFTADYLIYTLDRSGYPRCYTGQISPSPSYFQLFVANIDAWSSCQNVEYI